MKFQIGDLLEYSDPNHAMRNDNTDIEVVDINLNDREYRLSYLHRGKLMFLNIQFDVAESFLLAVHYNNKSQRNGVQNMGHNGRIPVSAMPQAWPQEKPYMVGVQATLAVGGTNCSHPKRYINKATMTHFWVCPDCKKDLGNA